MFFVYENKSVFGPIQDAVQRWVVDDSRFIQWHEKKIAGPIPFDEALALVQKE